MDAATSAAPSLTISRACAGPPTQATRAAPKRWLSRSVGGVPCGSTRPLARHTTAARAERSRASSEVMTFPSPADGTPRNTKSARAKPDLEAASRVAATLTGVQNEELRQALARLGAAVRKAK